MYNSRRKRGKLTPKDTSIRIDLLPLLALRGIANPFTFLVKNCRISNTSASKLLNNKAVQLNLNQLTTICQHLNCTPNDLFSLSASLQSTLAEGHALQNLRTENQVTASPNDWLQHKSIAELQEILKS